MEFTMDKIKKRRSFHAAYQPKTIKNPYIYQTFLTAILTIIPLFRKSWSQKTIFVNSHGAYLIPSTAQDNLSSLLLKHKNRRTAPLAAVVQATFFGR